VEEKRWNMDLKIHLLVDEKGSPVAFTSTPANRDERKEVELLLDLVKQHIDDIISKEILPILEADTMYDAE